MCLRRRVNDSYYLQNKSLPDDEVTKGNGIVWKKIHLLLMVIWQEKTLQEIIIPLDHFYWQTQVPSPIHQQKKRKKKKIKVWLGEGGHYWIG